MVTSMITLTIIAALFIMAALIAIVAIVSGGIGFLLTFGDIIVAILVIVLVVRMIFKDRSNNKKE